MLLKNKRKLNEAFVQHEGVECLVEGNVAYPRTNLVWDIYNMLTYEGASQFVCYGSDENAAQKFIQGTNNLNFLNGKKLLFVVKHNTNEVAAAILTGESSGYSENFNLEWADLFVQEYGGDLSNLNLILPERVNLKLDDEFIMDGDVCVGLRLAFLDLTKGKVINIPENVKILDDEAFFDAPQGSLNNFTFNFPQSIECIGVFTRDFEGCTFNFQCTEQEEHDKYIFTDDMRGAVSLAEADGVLTVNFKNMYDSEEDFKADVLGELDEQTNKLSLEALESNLNKIINKCFKYLKINKEDLLSEDIKNKIAEVRVIIENKKHLKEISKQNEFAFKINGNEAWIVDYFGSDFKLLIIPETYKGKLVTRLEKYALNTPDLKTIDELVLPKGIKHIGRDCIKSVKKILTVSDPKNISCSKKSLQINGYTGREGDTLETVWGHSDRLETISQEDYDNLVQGGSK